MNTIRNQRAKNFLKKLKENFLLKTTSSEMILLVVVMAMIFFKYSSENKASQKLPVGDFESTPTSRHAQSLEEIQDQLTRN